MTTDEAVALTIAYYAETENAIAERIPQEVWDRLHEQGYTRTAQDQSGEYVTATTREGFRALLQAVGHAS
jgi:hypothetical protein